ncbi:formylglycine-generating enzyme family protein [Candidatus Falkowbacteria bacterium]|nr:formylglycine-generating enzyme family protein [Candidatus Falkowbacteria bacterium]
MDRTINLKSKPRSSWLGTRELVVVVSSIVLTTVGIKAADNFMNAGDGQGNGPCPENMVQVLSAGGSFCIDKYEASAGPDCPHASPATQTETRNNLDNVNCKAASVKGALPWRNISQNQAASACAKAGKRLPTNREWFQSAMGTPDPEIGWGPDDCNVNSNWGSQPGQAGYGSKCISAAGANDMVGNVWEWVQGTIYNGEYDNRVLPKQGFVSGVDENSLPTETAEAADPNYDEDYLYIKNSGTRGIARGGYWDNKMEAGINSSYMVSSPSFAGAGIGFRCVK